MCDKQFGRLSVIGKGTCNQLSARQTSGLCDAYAGDDASRREQAA